MCRTSAMLFLVLTVCAAAGCNRGDPTSARVSAPTPPSFTTGNPINSGSGEAYTLAVIGDTPYGAAKLSEFPSLTALINADPKVDLVIHLGDIKAGSNAACTNEYFATVRALFDEFKDPFV